jgi:putative oxidoreductase
VRRLYSTFAGGWPGVGLLLMRLVVGSAVIGSASLTLWSDPPPMNVTIPSILLIAVGVLLIAGLWTPIAGASLALTEISKMLMLHGEKSGWLLLGTVGAAFAMLGPGLWSVDARLYGWKRLEPTPRKRTFNTPS